MTMTDKTNTAGVDLDKLEALAHDLRNLRALHPNDLRMVGQLASGALQLIDLARRAEPSVAAGDVRALNLLESCANWLRTRTDTVWAEQFGHSNIMKHYADGLTELRAALASPAVSQPRATEQAEERSVGGRAK
jgi:hypothetical protein